MNKKRVPGSSFWKFDFHTHTPASNCFKNDYPPNITPREWLIGFMKAGIDCVAITDHNSGEWIDRLKDEFNSIEKESHPEFCPLYLFPGVEITAHGGAHIIALFDPETKGSDIQSFLGYIGYKGNYGDPSHCASDTIPQVIEKTIKRRGIVIAAHADKEKGLFDNANIPTLKQILDHKPSLSAIELHDPDFKKPQVYKDLKCDLPEVLGSDSHKLDEIGRAFTWVKMSIPTIEGVRLALSDGLTSIIRSDHANRDPNIHASSVIESLEVRNASYIGRANLSPFKIDFNPWLTTIIGGRGTGKSSLIEFMRICLRRDDEIPKRLKDEFFKYMEVSDTHNGSGLLRENAKISLIYNKDNNRYCIQWDTKGEEEPILESHENEWRKTAGDIRHRFPIRIYSQKQIFEIANTPNALLKIVDESPVVNFSEWKDKWYSEEKRFLSLKAKEREILSELTDEERIKGELEDVKKKLSTFEKTGHREVLKEYQQRTRQEQAIETWRESLIQIERRMNAMLEQMIPDTLNSELFKEDLELERDIITIIDTTNQKFLTTKNQMEGLITRVKGSISEFENDVKASKWKSSVEEAKNRYLRLIEELKNIQSNFDMGFGHGFSGEYLKEYGRILQRRQELEKRLEDSKGQEKELSEIKRNADESLKRLANYRRELTKRRSDFLERITGENPYVFIEVIPYGDIEEAESAFRAIIGKDQPLYQNDILSEDRENGLLGEVYKGYLKIFTIGRNLSEIDKEKRNNAIDKIEDRLYAMKNKIRGLANKGIDYGILKDKRFGVYLSGAMPEVIDHIECWFPEDLFQVSYSTLRDTSKFFPITQGSPGQKTAAILAFLLSYGEEPLILDQPEDDLDNHLIYDLIVQQVRENKHRRQIIIVTHNPNIVVNGDAELVLALDVRGGQTQIIEHDGLQVLSVREEICRVMEGGREAFERRYRRIGMEGQNV